MRSQMTIRLPFRLAVQDGASFVTGYSPDDDGVDFRIDFAQRDLTISGQDWPDEILSATIVTITVDTLTTDAIDQPTVRHFFLLSLSYLNRVIDAHRMTMQDYNIREILLADLPPVIEITIDGISFMYIVHTPSWISNDTDDTELEFMKRIGAAMASWDRWPELLTVQRFYAVARSYLEQGDNFNAIINLETTFELQIRLTLKMIMNELHIVDPKRTKILKSPLRNALEEYFAKYLSGNFQYHSPGPVHDWYKDLYMLRNECIHDGQFFVSGSEVTKAFDAYHRVQSYIEDKLKERGFLEPNGNILIMKHAPRRQVEREQDILRQRLREKGMLPGGDGIFWPEGKDSSTKTLEA